MDKTAAVNYYHSLLRFGIKPGLERISVLLERLGNPQNNLKFIHIAGTNGKGSTCTELASVLSDAGYKTGLFTSPYVLDFCERIQIDNRMISGEDLVSITQSVKSVIDELSAYDIVITEFEAITAASFIYFAQKQCDVVVLETGLGGRFDATNIITTNLCSIITSVSLDHTSVLGNTISEIAFEKCGIIKQGSPVIFGASQHEDFIKVAVETANSKQSRIIIAEENNLPVLSETISGSVVEYSETEIRIPFPGAHQKNNTALVISCVEYLNSIGYNINIKALKSGIEKSFIPARTEIISSSPLIMLDGSHNPDSTKALAEVLSEFCNGRKLIGLCAMMKDKDCDENFRNLCSSFDTIICTAASNPRTATAFELAEICKNSCKAMPFTDRTDALKRALSLLTQSDGLIVFGSLYFASDIRPDLLKLKKEE